MAAPGMPRRQPRSQGLRQNSRRCSWPVSMASSRAPLAAFRAGSVHWMGLVDRSQAGTGGRALSEPVSAPRMCASQALAWGEAGVSRCE